MPNIDKGKDCHHEIKIFHTLKEVFE